MSVEDTPLGWRVLNTVFYSNDLDRELSIKDWWIEIMTALWDEQEGFSGKRPLGNSGWYGDPLYALIRDGLLKGSFKEEREFHNGEWTTYHEVTNYDRDAYDKLMREAIASL
jgi:hypothetical protein